MLNPSFAIHSAFGPTYSTNAPQHIRAVPNAPYVAKSRSREVAKALEQRESEAGLGGARGGGRLLLPVEGDRDGGRGERSPAGGSRISDLAGEVGGGAAADILESLESLESHEVVGVEGDGRGAKEDGALGGTALHALGAAQGSPTILV